MEEWESPLSFTHLPFSLTSAFLFLSLQMGFLCLYSHRRRFAAIESCQTQRLKTLSLRFSGKQLPGPGGERCPHWDRLIVLWGLRLLV